MGPSRGHLSRAWSRLIRKKLALVMIGVLVIVYAGGAFAPFISRYEYREIDLTASRQGPSAAHWFGTDLAGRDMFTRVLWGIQNTVILTLVAMLTGGLLIGVTLGLVSGYCGGRIEAVIMRVGEVFAAFPDIFLVIILAATLRPRIISIMEGLDLHGLIRVGVIDYVVVSLALVSFGWVGMARLVRGQILGLKQTEHIESARAIGASTRRIMFLHLLPNAISPIVVTVTMGMGAYVGTEIILSWLGLGIQPPRPSLGTMLLEAGSIGALRQTPWMLLGPGLAAFLLVLCWNILGDALNDVLNPRTR